MVGVCLDTSSGVPSMRGGRRGKVDDLGVVSLRKFSKAGGDRGSSAVDLFDSKDVFDREGLAVLSRMSFESEMRGFEDLTQA